MSWLLDDVCAKLPPAAAAELRLGAVPRIDVVFPPWCRAECRPIVTLFLPGWPSQRLDIGAAAEAVAGHARELRWNVRTFQFHEWSG